MIEYKSQDTARTWYVIFDKRHGGRMFWHIFTRKGFDHIWLITPLSQNILAIQPTPSECLVEEWPCTIERLLNHLSVTAILKFESKYGGFKPYVPRGIMSCVVIVKYILGVKGYCLTPLGLYKKLKQLGAEEMGTRSPAVAPLVQQSDQLSNTGNAAYDTKYNEYITRNAENIAKANEDVRQQFYDEADVQANQAAGITKKQATIQPTESELRDKAIRGDESAADIAAREKSSLANPKKQKQRGRRSLVSGASLGSGVNATRESLG